MGSYKTAAPCEFCGTRISHHGSSQGFIVGYTVKGIQRLVHERCRSEWNGRRQLIMSKWVELRSEVFPTLSVTLRHRIERCRSEQEGQVMAAPRKHDSFNFSPTITAAIEQRLVIEVRQFGRRRKGFVSNVYRDLQQAHPDLMPDQREMEKHYNEFLKVVTKEVEPLLALKLRTSTPAVPAPAVSSPVSTPEALEVPIVEEDDLVAMANAVIALTALALKRKNRLVLQFVLEAMGELLNPVKK